uniref:Uncharacterized protein n=1 Tax=Mus spicilegus TaxID=10103 RepID=A0A8C6GFE7_MUSSI
MLTRDFSEMTIRGGSTQRPAQRPPWLSVLRSLTPGTGHSGPPQPCPRSVGRRVPAAAAGLLTDRVHAMREKQGPRATASGGGGRLGPRVPSSDNYHVEVRGAGRRAVAAEATQRQPSAEGRCGPTATASEKEHVEGS